jgi:PAS domain S-box-containing protein
VKIFVSSFAFVPVITTVACADGGNVLNLPLIKIVISGITVVFFLIVYLTIVFLVKKIRATEAQSRHYRNLFDEINDAIVMIQLDFAEKGGSVVEVNNVACVMSGYSRDEFLRMTLRDFIEEVPAEQMQSETELLMSRRRITIQRYMITKSGERKPIEVSIRITTYMDVPVALCVTRDISERIKAQEDLFRKTEEFNRYFSLSLDLLCIADSNGFFKRLNNQWEQLLGYSLAELEGTRYMDLVHPDDVENTLAAMQQLSEQKPVLNFVNRYRRKDGSYRCIEWRSAPEGDLVYASARDITERIELEKKLLKNESLMRSFVENAPYGVHLYELRDGNTLVFEGANHSANRILGIDHNRFIGKSLDEDGPFFIGSILSAALKKTAVSGEQFSTEFSFKTDNGDTIIFDMHVFQNRPGHCAVLFIDITDRKQAERLLATEKERLLVTLRSIGDGVITTDIEGCVVLMNSVAEALTGWSLQDASGKSVTEIFNTVDERTGKTCPDLVSAALREGRIVENVQHTVLLSRNGDRSIISDNVAPIIYTDGSILGSVLVFRDITEHHRIEEGLKSTQRLESLGILAGGIAHDFNNLLSGLFGYYDLARQYALVDDKENLLASLDSALSVFDRAKGLTQQLLTFAKGGDPVRKICKMEELIRNCVSFVLSGTSIQARMDIQPDLWNCEIDPNQIGQVIDNIIINAQQAMNQNGVLSIAAINTDINTLPESRQYGTKYIRIDIADNGVGISPDDIYKIFDPFYTTKSQGSGLGLATAYSIIKRHNGHIDVTSSPEKGSLFSIYLPAVEGTLDKSYKNQDRPPDGKGRILVMDDEPYICKIAQRLLVSFGYDVVVASDGKEALKIIYAAEKTGEYIDLAILDLTVPGGPGGADIVNEIVNMPRRIYAVASSGYSDDPIMANPRNFGFSASLPKPYRKNEIGALVKEVLSGNR